MFAACAPGFKPEQGIFAHKGEGGGEIFVKRHKRSTAKALLDALAGRPTPSARAFRVGCRLGECAVDAARPLASIERKWPGVNYLLLEYLEGPTLRQYLIDTLGASRNEAERSRHKIALWSMLAPTIARLHAARVRQRDLKAVNILVIATPDPHGPLRTPLVDLEGMQLLRSLPSHRRRARDLGRLAASLRTAAIRNLGVDISDWEHFLNAYLAAAKATFPAQKDIRWWMETTTSWAERKEARNLRRGKPFY